MREREARVVKGQLVNRQVEGRGDRPVKACLPDEEVCLTLSRIPHVFPPPSKADPGLAMPRKHGVELERGRPEIVERILKLLESGPLRSSAIRKAVGICSGIHLSRYYLTPMMEKGLIKRTDPDHPQSPQQRYQI